MQEIRLNVLNSHVSFKILNFAEYNFYCLLTIYQYPIAVAAVGENYYFFLPVKNINNDVTQRKDIWPVSKLFVET